MTRGRESEGRKKRVMNMTGHEESEVYKKFVRKKNG